VTFEPTAEHLALERRLARQKALTDIEDCHVQVAGGLLWYDTRPMTDPREHCNEALDLANEVLAYADYWKLITRHPTQPWLVRVNTN
jgi:hypothetical protein